MEKTLQDSISLTREVLEVIKHSTIKNDNINKSLVKLLLVTNLMWAILVFSTVYVYFTTDYDYYGETSNYNENINRNTNE